MDKLNQTLQENVLTLLCFDDVGGRTLSLIIDSQAFDTKIFQTIAEKAINFNTTYGKAPKDHLGDLLEIELADSKSGPLYNTVLQNLNGVRNGLNREYVLGQLTQFIDQQSLKTGLLSAVRLVQEGDFDGAKVALGASLKTQQIVFNAGIRFSDPEQSLNFLTKMDDAFPTGVKTLDDMGIGPRPQTLFTLMAPSGRGKSWGLIHMGKSAIMARKKVLHVTLEMSQDQVSKRYIQSFFSLSRWQAEKVRVPILDKDELGRMVSFDFAHLERDSLQDTDARKKIARKLTLMQKRPTLYIKQFPSGALTIKALNAYIESLDKFEHFQPDQIILDYGDLMQMSRERMREDTGRIFIELRGLAAEHNVAMVTATQTNRESANARIVDETMVAEDWSKIMTSDTVLSYNQTLREKELGLARLFVVKARDEQDKMLCLITQAYAIGQFCLDSSRMAVNYWNMVDPPAPAS